MKVEEPARGTRDTVAVQADRVALSVEFLADAANQQRIYANLWLIIDYPPYPRPLLFYLDIRLEARDKDIEDDITKLR